jgi:hypothetical protein
MINTQLERLVQIALQSYESAHGRFPIEQAQLFELHFRKNLMQCYCNDTGQKTASVEGATVRWVTRDCPPTISTTNQLLHG